MLTTCPTYPASMCVEWTKCTNNISLTTVRRLVFVMVMDCVFCGNGAEWCSFIHSTVCLKTVPQTLPQPVLHRLRSSASSFNLQYPLFSLKSTSSCLPLLPRLPVTSILPSVFPSTTYCIRRTRFTKLKNALCADHVRLSVSNWRPSIRE